MQQLNYYDWIHWPSSIFISILILFCASITVNRMSQSSFFILYSILFLGCYPSMVNILPLFFIHKIPSEWKSAFWFIMKLLLCWGGGFLIGYACVRLYLYSEFGTFSSTPIGLRQPHLTSTFQVLYENIIRAFSLFSGQIEFFFSKAHFVYFLPPLILLIIQKKSSNVFFTLLLMFLILISTHALTIIHGYNYIPARALINVYCAFFAIFLFESKTNNAKLIIAICCLMVTVNLATVNFDKVEYLRTTKNIWTEQLIKMTSSQPESFAGLIITSPSTKMQESERMIIESQKLTLHNMETLGLDYWWRPSAFAAGYKNTLLCGESDKNNSRCKDLKYSTDFNDHLKSKEYTIYNILGITKDHYLVIEFK